MICLFLTALNLWQIKSERATIDFLTFSFGLAITFSLALMKPRLLARQLSAPSLWDANANVPHFAFFPFPAPLRPLVKLIHRHNNWECPAVPPLSRNYSHLGTRAYRPCLFFTALCHCCSKYTQNCLPVAQKEQIINIMCIDTFISIIDRFVVYCHCVETGANYHTLKKWLFHCLIRSIYWIRKNCCLQ